MSDTSCMIPLSKGYFAVVDPEDYESLSKFKWHVRKSHGMLYAERHNPKTKHKLSMHRHIMEAKPGQHIDHRDGNGLNNRKGNLRYCTVADNNRNKLHWKKSKSGFRGVKVCTDRTRPYFTASISIENRQMHLGCYPTAADAARAYDEAARLYHGQFAVTNFGGANA